MMRPLHCLTQLAFRRSSAAFTPACVHRAVSRGAANPRGAVRRLCSAAEKKSKPAADAAETTLVPGDGGRGRGPVSWAGFAALVIGGAGAVGYFQYVREREKKKVAHKVTSYGKPALGGPWELVNQDGVPVTDASYQGEYLLLYFGFTYCPDICPSELVKMGKVVTMLDGEKNLPRVRPIFISLDPNRDTVAQMKAYIQDFHPRMEALTGTPEQVGRAAKHYRVYFSDVDREEDDDDYVVDHSIIMYFVAPNGEFLEFFTQLAEPDEIVEKMSFHLRNMTGFNRA